MNLPGFFRRAKIASKHSTVKRIQVGAAISKGGRLIATGYNQKKSHPLVPTYTLHAEAAAIISRRHYDASLKGTTLWVYRELSTGVPAMSRPCESCMELIHAAEIKKIYFSVGVFPYYRVLRL